MPALSPVKIVIKKTCAEALDRGARSLRFRQFLTAEAVPLWFFDENRGTWPFRGPDLCGGGGGTEAPAAWGLAQHARMRFEPRLAKIGQELSSQRSALQQAAPVFQVAICDAKISACGARTRSGQSAGTGVLLAYW